MVNSDKGQPSHEAVTIEHEDHQGRPKRASSSAASGLLPLLFFGIMMMVVAVISGIQLDVPSLSSSSSSSSSFTVAAFSPPFITTTRRRRRRGTLFNDSTTRQMLKNENKIIMMAPDTVLYSHDDNHHRSGRRGDSTRMSFSVSSSCDSPFSISSSSIIPYCDRIHRRRSLCSSSSMLVMRAKNSNSKSDDMASLTPPEPPINSTSTSSTTTTIWSPELRRIMGGVAGLGAVETALLTWDKIHSATNGATSLTSALCGTTTTGGYCNDVLNGPYAIIPGTRIPLAAVGCAAYLLTAILALAPTLIIIMVDDDNDTDDSNNRVALLAITTAMGTFSVFLMSLLYGVLHQSCLYCLASALFSFTLASCAWLGGLLPERKYESQVPEEVSSSLSSPSSLSFVKGSSVGTINYCHRKLGLQASLGSFIATTMAAAILFVNVEEDASAYSNAYTEPQSPPAITTSSSNQALRVAKDLKMLNAQMYGAYWCSHCYDQKQTFGKEAFQYIPYIECSKDGMNSQTALCKERDVPGYPTWEINGKLYPGEQELDELEAIVTDTRK